MIREQSHSREENVVWIEPIDGDATPVVLDAIQKAKDGITLRFKGDYYHFWPQHGHEAYYYISNNQHGLKRIAFPLIGKRDVVIDGEGAHFIFHGEVIPFVIDRSENITLKNFSVDWKRPFFSQGEVEEVSPSGVTVRIDFKEYPYRFERGSLIFEGEGWESELTEGVFAFDPITRAPAYRSGDSLGLGFPERIHAEGLEVGRIRLCEPFPNPPNLGDLIVFRHYRRKTPAIFMVHAKELLLEAITLYQAGGMGFIAQFCENVELRNCTVTPQEGRIFSVCADASHFVNCRGLIRLENCLFENQLDDPLNVHGLNTRIKEVVDEHTLIVERVHPEQHGVDIGLVGDRVQISHNQTLLPYARNEISVIEPIDAQYLRVRFATALSEITEPGHVVENLSWTPDLHVRGCTVRNNRARGLLFSTPGEVVAEGNNISSGGSGVKISGDANYWFESGAVRDVLIRDNDFGECAYGAEPWGRAVIDIDPEIAEPEKNISCFHRNIRIVDNRIATSDSRILFARSVEGLRFSGNTIRATGFYPSPRSSRSITLEACTSVDIGPNEGLEESEDFSADPQVVRGAS